jgi:hypothetical protein
MMQVAGDGEACLANMKADVSAVISGTKYDGKIHVEYLWRKTREGAILKSANQYEPKIMRIVALTGFLIRIWWIGTSVQRSSWWMWEWRTMSQD